jgi:hypothetical protein
MNAALALALSLVTLGAGPDVSPGFETLVDGGEPLRAAFDAAHGKVRAILLVSPT